MNTILFHSGLTGVAAAALLVAAPAAFAETQTTRPAHPRPKCRLSQTTGALPAPTTPPQEFT